MVTLLAFTVGALFAASVYLLLRRSMVRFVFGMILLSNAVNLLLFTLGRLTRGQPPLIAEEHVIPAETIANPVAQALMLTSIVISFGLLAFLLVLVYRTDKEHETTDVDDLQLADAPPEH